MGRAAAKNQETDPRMLKINRACCHNMNILLSFETIGRCDDVLVYSLPKSDGWPCPYGPQSSQTAIGVGRLYHLHVQLVFRQVLRAR